MRPRRCTQERASLVRGSPLRGRIHRASPTEPAPPCAGARASAVLLVLAVRTGLGLSKSGAGRSAQGRMRHFRTSAHATAPPPTFGTPGAAALPLPRPSALHPSRFGGNALRGEY